MAIFILMFVLEEDRIVDAVMCSHVEPDVESICNDEDDCGYSGDVNSSGEEFGFCKAEFFVCFKSNIKSGRDDEAKSTSIVLEKSHVRGLAKLTQSRVIHYPLR